MFYKKKNLLAFLFLICIYSGIYAKTYNVNDVPNDLLNNANDFVSNPDGIISDNAEANINRIIKETQDSTTAQISVVLLQSIGNENIDQFATELFEKWGIGKSKKDNGLLFLLVEDQHKMVFRTGYGLEGILPDIVLSRLIRNVMAPEMKKNNPDAALIQGISVICKYLSNPETIPEIKDESSAPTIISLTNLFKIYLSVSFIIALIAFIFLFKTSTGKDSDFIKYTRLDSAKNLILACTIFFPVFMVFFIIVFFTIKSRLRNRPLICENCGQKMHKLSEKEEDRYLNQSQQEEEIVKSVDYDVWLCRSCHNVRILPYSKISKYSECPQCHARTYSLCDNYIEREATPFSTGEGVRVYECKNCGYKNIKKYILPIIILPTGRGNDGGPFGGNSGGGLWGGGSTGGGGASGGW